MIASLGLGVALAFAAAGGEAPAPVPPAAPGASRAAAPAAAPVDGLVAGRLAVFESKTLVSLRRVEAVLRQPVTLGLRRGRALYDARPDADGFFVFRAPPGRYRLEFLAFGGRAEFFPPREVEVRGGTLLCTGTMSFSVYRVELLGDNSASRVELTNDCARTLPRIRQITRWQGRVVSRLPPEVPLEDAPRSLSAAELLVGLRVEAAVNGTELALRGWYVYALTESVGEPAALTLHVSGGRVTGPGPGLAIEVAGGLGINLFGPVELVGAGGARVGTGGFPTAPFVAAIMRAGFAGAGLDIRAQWTVAGPTLFVGVDVAPFFLLGTLL